MSSRPRRFPGLSRWTVEVLLIAVSWLHPALLPSALAAHASGAERATVDQDSHGDTWTLTAGGAHLTIHVDPESGYALQSLQGPNGARWLTKAAPDTSIVVRGNRLGFGRRDAGFQFEQAATRTDGSRVRLDLAFVHRPTGLRATRHVAIVDNSPTFEVWTTLEAPGDAVEVSDLNGVELTVPAGTLRWLNGLRGSTSDQGNPEAFLTQERILGEGDRLTLGAQGRSSEATVPWIAVHGTDEEHPETFYAGLLWSGAWRLDAAGASDGLTLSIGLADMTTRVTDRAVETPHVVFGVSEGGLPQASAAMRQYLVDGVRSGRGFTPLVTYNTWFVDGVRISDESIRGEMRRVAGLGAELFVLDAGWYRGTGAEGVFDFSSGLGRWQPDADRFPDGLRPLTEYAHALGMKFGVWVEPERMDLDVVREQGAEPSWLATAAGHSVTARTGQFCLAGAAGRAWLWARLTAFLDEVQPDYLKWDNNAWQNCDRDGHGHGDTDGNFAHVTALYGLLADLRARYPDLLIENVSGGGNRLDFGMLRYSDVGWMDDRSGPSAHVRHNIQGLAQAFPPAYLFSFVTTQDASEGLNSEEALALYFRSRMMGAFGISFLIPGLLTERTMADEIARYKRLRSILREASGALLSDQAMVTDGPTWDAFQASSGDGTRVLVYVFQNGPDDRAYEVQPIALDADATYHVESLDSGPVGLATGRELMTDGIEVFPEGRTGAEILILEQRGNAPE